MGMMFMADKKVKKENQKKKEPKKAKEKILKKKIDDFKNREKDSFTTKELIIVMLFSLGIGFLMCFGCISLITGKNYIAVTRDLAKVVDTYYAIVDNYYGDLDRDELVDGAVEGMISSVGDSFTSYTNTEDTNSFNETINGSYEGIGCSIATYAEGNKIVVIEVFSSSPAEKAGLQVGDVIIKVDGDDYREKNGSDVSTYIKDSGKDKVVLTIERDGAEKDITINLSKVEIPYDEMK